MNYINYLKLKIINFNIRELEEGFKTEFKEEWEEDETTGIFIQSLNI